MTYYRLIARVLKLFLATYPFAEPKCMVYPLSILSCTNGYDFTIDEQNFSRVENLTISLAVELFKSSKNSSCNCVKEVWDQPQRDCESA